MSKPDFWKSVLLTALSLMMVIAAAAQGSSQARDIVQRAVDKQNGKSGMSLMTMKIIRPSWEREVSIKSWTLGSDYMLMLITAPARDAGTAFLKRDREIWNWQPRIQRSIKLPPSMMTQSWMGSDFTNDDLVEQSSMVDDYRHTLDGSETVDGLDCHRIIMIPREDAAVIWGKVIVWIDKQEYMELKAEFYDEDGEKINTMYGREPKLLDGVLLPSKLEVIPEDKPGNRTVVTIEELTFNIDVSESYFTEQQMKRLR
jgi:outer membrane lipoprotein-sorting protein